MRDCRPSLLLADRLAGWRAGELAGRGFFSPDELGLLAVHIYLLGIEQKEVYSGGNIHRGYRFCCGGWTGLFCLCVCLFHSCYFMLGIDYHLECERVEFNRD